MADSLWKESLVGDEHFQLLNLDHGDVEQRVIAEMKAGIEVFYDRRWRTTSVLTDYLSRNKSLFRNMRVLVLGAGVGTETLILGRHADYLWINDLAPTALSLCAEQLEKNSITQFTPLCGRYEELELPEVDLVVASFLIYNRGTYDSMRAYLSTFKGSVILVNERLAPFPLFLQKEEHSIIFEEDDAVGVRLDR